MRKGQVGNVATAMGAFWLALCLVMSPAPRALADDAIVPPDPAETELPGDTDPSDDVLDDGTSEEDPVAKDGFVLDDDGARRYYVDGEAVTGLQEIDGTTYLFGDDGALAEAGWTTLPSGETAYILLDGSCTTGWSNIMDGQWHYFDPETFAMKTGVFDVKGVTYVADANGVCPANAWVQVDGTWYRTNRSSACVKGWAKVNGKWYWFEPEQGAMATGVFTAKGVDYVANNSGACPANAWVKVGNDWYRTDASSACVKGWAKVNGKWYYFDPADHGRMLTGFIEVNGKTYHMTSNGDMTTGWIKTDGDWHYAASSGAIASKWAKIGGKWYWFDPQNDNIMVADCKLDINGKSYTFTKSGALLAGWVKSGGEWYFYDDNSQLQTGWLKSGGWWYYLQPSDGKMVKGWQKIDGKWNAFDKKNGIWRTDNATFINGAKTAKRLGSPTDYFIMVDDTNTRVMIYHWEDCEWYPLYRWACTSGAKEHRTVHGVFHVGSRGYSFGHGYTCYYWTQFYNDYLFHSTKYVEGTMEHMEPWLNAHLSMGCVRLQIDNAKWIYDNIPTGTTVYVY